MAPWQFPPYSRAVNRNHEHRALTFGKLIASARETCGSHTTAGTVLLAVKPHSIEFHRRDRFVILAPASERIPYGYE